MVRPTILPDAEVLRKLRDEEGMRVKDIAEKYGVTVSGVQKALRRTGLAEAQSSYKEIVPWTVDPRLSDTAIMHRLRAIVRQKHGQRLEPIEQRKLDEWFDMLMNNGLVLDYHDEAPANMASSLGGFFYRSRVPEDSGERGGGWYREPWINQILWERKKKLLAARGELRQDC